MTAAVLSLLSAPAIRGFYRAGYWRGETIYALARGHAERTPGRIGVRDRFRRLTWAELVALADALAADLAHHGLGRGSRVFVWAPNRIETVAAFLACSRQGYVCCPSLHRNHTVAEVIRLMERARCKAFIHEAGFGADAAARDVAAEAGEVGSLRHFYTLPPAGADAPFAGLPQAVPDAAPDADPDSVVYLAFTSGSTGVPKGVMHSDNTLLATARRIVVDWRLGPGSVVYSMSPLSHNLGLGTMLTALVAGAELVLHDLPRGASILDRLVETGTTYLVGVPTHAIDVLAELEARGIERPGRIAGFRISGAAVPGHVLEGLLDRGVLPQSGYGMTETNAHQYTLPEDDRALIVGSSGRACAGYELRAWDADDPDVPAAPGAIGQIGGRGASLMLGYFDDQAATEASFNAHGWFMTGDLGWIDENGYLRITGRAKEVIIRGGHNINPARIEELAMQHAGVERAAAIPVAEPRLGEQVCLAVMLRPGENGTGAREILAHLTASGLSRLDMPELFLALDDIPLMPNGKVEKRALVEQVRAGRLKPLPVRAREGGS